MGTQSEDANPLQKRLSGAVENYQVIGGDELGPGRLENVVNLLPGITVRSLVDGTLHSHRKHSFCMAAGSSGSASQLDALLLLSGGLRVQLHVGSACQV